jgi:small basic protein (TIGR04137 family)
MSVHPSFKSGKGKQQKSVLKRLARLLLLQKEEKWEEDKNSIFGLPKVKVLKLKFKKDKKEAPEGEDAVADAAKPDASAAAEKSKEAPKPGAKDKGKK